MVTVTTMIAIAASRDWDLSQMYVNNAFLQGDLFEELTDALIEAGYKKSSYDHSLFTKRDGDDIVIILMYLDDILITGSNKKLIEEAKDAIHITGLNCCSDPECSFSTQGVGRGYRITKALFRVLMTRTFKGSMGDPFPGFIQGCHTKASIRWQEPPRRVPCSETGRSKEKTSARASSSDSLYQLRDESEEEN
nr:uncharacterized protein LOC104103744 [Nicotiana tomentosiformis]